MYFTGMAGLGHAVILMKSGKIMGADATGVLLDGTYNDTDGGKFNVDMKLTIPVGTRLVTGFVVDKEPVTQSFQTVLPANFGNGNQIGVQTPTGPINAVFKRLRDAP